MFYISREKQLGTIILHGEWTEEDFAGFIRLPDDIMASVIREILLKVLTPVEEVK